MKRLTLEKDLTAQVLRALKELPRKKVLIGIPTQTSPRARDEYDGPLNNAAIGYIQEHGSPEANIPPRPFLIPGVKNSNKKTTALLREAIVQTLALQPDKAEKALTQAGLIASDSVREEISSNIPPPLAPATIRGRKYTRGTQSRRSDEEKYLKLVGGGVDPGTAQRATGIVSLINTGQLRNSITFVIRRT